MIVSRQSGKRCTPGRPAEPFAVVLDAKSRVILEMHAKACSMSGAQVMVSALHDDLEYLLKDASSETTCTIFSFLVLS